MANTFFNSADVIAFPTTYRVYNVGGKYTSEFNITNALKAFIAGKSFVIDEPSEHERNTIKVVLDGYYFEIALSAFSGSQVPANLYLGIRVEESYLVNIDNKTVNLDVDSKFKGLVYNVGSAPTGCTKTLQVTGNDGGYVNTSFIPTIADENGNWYDFSKLINMFIIDGDSAYIDPRYIKNDIAVTLNKFTVGAAKKLVNDNGTDVAVGGKGTTQTYVYFSGGKPVAGNRTTISTSQPSNYTGVQTGDLWFVLKG